MQLVTCRSRFRPSQYISFRLGGIAGCINSGLKKLELASNGVDELGWTAEMTIRLGLRAGKILTYGPIPTMVFDPGAT